VILGAPTPPGATVPGPLPLLGAGAAFGWSRRLRKRIAAPLSTPPQA
jgi:MYXO-CTERM domain-containing protein